MGHEEVEKISNFLNVKPLQVQHMENKLALGDLSLNKTIDNEDGPYLLSILKANSLTPDEVVEKNNDNKLKNEWLAKSIELLNSREREIILSRNLGEHVTIWAPAISHSITFNASLVDPSIILDFKLKSSISFLNFLISSTEL